MSGVSRRAFLKAGAAGLAGAALEAGAERLAVPARKPWNASSGRSLRKYRDPLPTVCRSCPAHCGLLACRDGDRVVQVGPSRGSPTNLAGLCPGAHAGLERMYDPDRVLTPLRRAGPRGSGRWRPVSWDEALEELRAVLDRSTGERVLHLGQEELLAEELRPALGWTRVLVDQPVSGRPGPGSGEVFYGAPVLAPDLRGAKSVFLFGAPLLDGPLNLPLAEALVAALQQGARVHLFDSFQGATGTLAAWEAVRPGSEGAVALGLARMLLESERFDAKGLRAGVAEPPERLLGALAAYTPAAVGGLSGLPEHRLRSLAEAFAGDGPAVAWAPAGSAAVPGVALLNHLVGAVEAPGGVRRSRGPFFVRPLRPAQAPEACLSELASGRARAALYLACGANPAYDSPASSRVSEVLADEQRVAFLVALDTHLHETAALADLFLPLATPFESWGLCEGCLPDGRTYLFLQQPATRGASEAAKLRAAATPQPALFEPTPKALGQARSAADVLIALARGREGEDGRFADARAFLAETVQRSWGPGSLESLARRGVWVSEEARPPEHASAVALLPHLPPLPAPPPSGRLELVGRASTALVRTYGNSRRGLEIAHRCEAYLNRETGRRLGLRDGDRVVLTTAAGEVEVPVKLLQGIHPEAVLLPDGLGRRAGGAAARARNGRPAGAAFDGRTEPAEPLWWEEEGPGVSYRSLVPFRLGPDGAQCWDAVEVRLRKA